MRPSRRFEDRRERELTNKSHACRPSKILLSRKPRLEFRQHYARAGEGDLKDASTNHETTRGSGLSAKDFAQIFADPYVTFQLAEVARSPGVAHCVTVAGNRGSDWGISVAVFKHLFYFGAYHHKIVLSKDNIFCDFLSWRATIFDNP